MNREERNGKKKSIRVNIYLAISLRNTSVSDGSARSEEFSESVGLSIEREISNEDGGGVLINGEVSRSLVLRLGLLDDEVSSHEFTVGTFDSLVAAFFGLETDESKTLRAAVFILQEVNSGNRAELLV